MQKYSHKELEGLCRELTQPSVLVQLIFGFVLMILGGFTVMMLWRWFVVPLGFPAISLAHAIGIDMLITFVATTTTPTDVSDVFWYRLIYSISMTETVLFFGFVVHLFM